MKQHILNKHIQPPALYMYTPLTLCTHNWKIGVDLSSVNMGVRVSQVKPSNCFRLHPKSMISKHSTIPIEKLVLPSILTHFIVDDVKLAELSDNSFEW